VFGITNLSNGYYLIKQTLLCLFQSSLFYKSRSDLYISVSKPAPDWEGSAVIHGEFKQLKLSDYKGKYLVLLFYPLDL
jgi:hypothetical protein